ncbi:uncharacterized protein LOC112565290 isoform X2 [Pomacea canaliculata]|nr:uncharacterized protein LOC112565290 isoform X2 [Pomacea canaliculata]
MNDYRGDFRFMCDNDQVIIAFFSIYNIVLNDRIFDFVCGSIPNTDYACLFLDYANSPYKTDKYDCSRNLFFNGVISSYVNNVRKFSIYCCTSDNIKMRDCFDSTVHQRSEGLVLFYVPAGKLLKGFHIEGHNPSTQRFVFQVCSAN